MHPVRRHLAGIRSEIWRITASAISWSGPRRYHSLLVLAYSDQLSVCYHDIIHRAGSPERVQIMIGDLSACHKTHPPRCWEMRIMNNTLYCLPSATLVNRAAGSKRIVFEKATIAQSNRCYRVTIVSLSEIILCSQRCMMQISSSEDIIPMKHH